MNKRAEFTRLISQLIIEMSNEGDVPVFDWLLRDEKVQRMMFDKGLSKCDGEVKKSQHQFGTAVDIYLCDSKGNIIFDLDAKGNEEFKKRMLYWHSVWDKLKGGEKMIRWDKGHFQL